jgi:hypothetical protein
VTRQQLGWVCARESGGLIGFVNVARDRCVHAFVLDTVAALSGSAGKPDRYPRVAGHVDIACDVET